MKKFGQKLIIGATSGLVGVLITICYQHFLAKPQAQSFTFVYNGEKIVVTEDDYISQEKQNELLQNKVINLQNEITDLENENNILDAYSNEIRNELDQSNNKIKQLSNEVKQLNNRITQLNETIDNFPSIEFSDIYLSINGTIEPIDPSNSSVIINEKTYYVDDFINRILSPNTMSIKDNTMYIAKTGGANNPIPLTETVSIFDLETFQGESRWYHNWSDSELTDTYGNEYPNGRYTNHRSDNKYTPTYLLDYKYSKCEGKVAWSKEEKNTSGSCWIDFYSGDTLIYSTDPISATDRPLSFEFSVKNVETLKIVCKANLSRKVSVPIIYEYFNLVP